MTMKRQFKSFDFILVLLVCIVAVFGIVVIGSATHIKTVTPLPQEYTMQKIWFASGIVLMLLAAFTDYHFICKFYIPLYVICILLLVYVFVFPSNQDSGVTRWISIGKLGIQPSEFAKIFMIIFVSKFVDKKIDSINNIFVLLFTGIAVALPFFLIFKQPSLSAAMVILAVSLTIIFVGGLSFKYIIPALAALVSAVLLMYQDFTRGYDHFLFVDKILPGYQIDRIMMALNPNPKDELYYQTMNSINAIASGQMGGKGLYQGTLNQLQYLAESHNDFIFSVIGEEFGFIGCITLMIVMMLIILKCVLIAHRSADTLGRLLASGVAAMLAFQMFVNVGVATGIINTGMPFPFVSYGGSSMWMCMVGIGLCINVGMTKTKSIFEE